MPERAILREHFTRMLQVAERAAQRYDQLARGARPPAEKDQLRRLARDGQRQVGLAERLLEIVSE